MSKPTMSESSRLQNINWRSMDFWEKAGTWLVILVLFLTGIGSLFAPEKSYNRILFLFVAMLVLYGFSLIVIYLLHGRSRKADGLFGVLALLLAAVLTFNEQIPKQLVQFIFGFYCLFVSIVMTVQILIHLEDGVKVKVSNVLFAIAYAILALLLFTMDLFGSGFLVRLFGIYFILLASRMMLSMLDMNSAKYRWKRGLYISLPTVLAAVLPDVAVRKINEKFRVGQTYELESIKRNDPVKLRAMVHIGPEGFQKIGHFSFSWKGIVYSYGNYDAKSGRFFTTIGDGVYFNVPDQVYLENIVKYEHNTIFEYSIQTTPEQDEKIEACLKDLKDRSYRWYCDLEKKQGNELGDLESDYPCRLHYRTGAKFYKLRKGPFKTYWAGGDNCVLFSEVILGNIGADVLSLRGIITPGAYFDYLENEYAKENSPIIERKVYSEAASRKGI